MKKKQGNKPKPKKTQGLADYWDIPPDILPQSMTIELWENKRFVLHGNVEILRYAQEQICVRCKEYLLSLKGEELEIAALSAEQIVIVGRIAVLEYTCLAEVKP